MLLEQIIMNCFLNIRAERSSFAIYHLITGKKSIQTIQDAHLFKLDIYYRIHRKLCKKEFQHIVEFLNKKNLLESVKNKNREDYYRITEQGKIWLKLNSNYKLRFFKGNEFSHYDQLFLKRLYLSIQTFSNTLKSYYQFISIIDDRSIELWTKKLYKVVKKNEKVYLEKLYNELQFLLAQFQEDDSELFVDRLTGYLHYGKSIDQIALNYNLIQSDVILTINALTHKILEDINKDPLKYPILSFYIKTEKLEMNLSKSASNTYALLKTKESLERIAVVRNLKMNTVYDHIVEITLCDDSFSIEPYVTKQQIAEIRNTIRLLKSSKLKMLKEHVHENITFFQIRLILAKYGNE